MHRGKAIGRTGGQGRGWRWNWLWAALFSLGASWVVAAAEPGAEEAFDGAARLFEQGKFREAAAVYERLATNGQATLPVLFNLGNAWLRAGEEGRAIVSYRQAWWLAPRDPDLLANLDLARGRVGAGGPPGNRMLDRVLGVLTPNEWAVAAIASVWAWFGWMMVREFVPRFRVGAGSGPWLTAVLVALVMTSAFVSQARVAREQGVVIVSEATVRFGPLEEAQTAFTLVDGTEVWITDRKGDWTEIRDPQGRRGWMAVRNLARVP